MGINSMAASGNPYASPSCGGSVGQEIAHAPSEVEELRYRYLKHEAAIRAVGGLYCVSGMLAVLACSFGILSLPALRMHRDVPLSSVFLLLFCDVVAIIVFVLGGDLRRLEGRARVPVIVVSILGLIQVPAAPVHIYVLYLMFSSKAKMVFSPEYRAAIEQTPHIRYKTSRTTWIVLILFILLTVAAVGLMVYWG